MYNDNELVYMVKEDEEALSVMIHKYEPLFKKLAFSFAKKYNNKGIEVEDLVQQCRIAMCYALEKYDTNNETLFYSYLLVCLNRGIKNYMRTFFNTPDVYYYMENENVFYNNVTDNISSYDIVLEKDLNKTLKEFTFSLDFLDSCIFELRFNNFSYKEISKILNISTKKVDNTLLKIRKKLENFIYL